jgi:hypothetical protein
MPLDARLLSRRVLPAVIGAGLAAVIGATAGMAADAPRSSAGTATRTTPTQVVPRKTREELVREWDIDSDGKIDIGEAEVAASRMRLERANLRLNSGFDPVTGQPRGESEPEVVEDQEEPEADLAAEVDAAPPPPTKKPGPQTTASGTQPARSGSARLPTQRPIPVAGGVRAGAQAARPGYGAATAPSLNAGRPLAAAQPSTTPRPLNAAASAQQAADGQRGPGPAGPGAGASAQRPRGGLLPRPPLQPPPRSRDLYDPY